MLDLESLKGLAHPLRIQIFDILAVHGPSTASGLAERLGESSGATSYHLRQLERHGFVREVMGKGTGRERWWERTPGGIDFGTNAMRETPVGREASSLVLRQWQRNREQQMTDFVERGPDVVSEEWVEASSMTTVNLRLTHAQLKVIGEAFEKFSEEQFEQYRGKDSPGARPVQIQFNAFPVLSGEETPEHA
ncbi:MAG: helix-turn-helix domain-containing protein [Lacisediminihabitans sp.]